MRVDLPSSPLEILGTPLINDIYNIHLPCSTHPIYDSSYNWATDHIHTSGSKIDQTDDPYLQVKLKQ